MGRGSRRNRKQGVKRQRDDDDDEEITCPHLEVSYWKRDDDDEEESEESRATIPPPLTAQHFTIRVEAPPPPSGLDAAMWKALLGTWKALCQRSGGSWSTPTTIQLQAWSILLGSSSKNVLQLSPTGSGKTFAYGLPMLLESFRASSAAGITGLVLVPTRELALQVRQSLVTVSQCATARKCIAASVSVVACYGGVDKEQQRRELLLADKSPLIVTATMGRLLDILQEEEVNIKGAASIGSLFQSLKTIVLDEADRLAMNKDLCEQTHRILELVNPKSRVRMVMCSATWPDRATPAWNAWVAKPCVVVKVDAMSVAKQVSPPKVADDSEPAVDFVPADAALLLEEDHDSNDDKPKVKRDLLLSKIPANLTQVLHVCAEHKKPKKLLATLDGIRKSEKEIAGRDPPNRGLGIIFFAKIKTVQYIAEFLAKEKKIICAELHSLLHQTVREKTIRDFTSGKVPLLLATDIAARGIHANNVRFVIHYDFPGNLEQYVHRSGRAGRGCGGGVGTVYSFFTRNLAPLAADMVALLVASEQWVDPNLRALVVSEKSRSVKTAAAAAAAMSQQETKASAEKDADSSYSNSDFEQDDPFKELSAKRIVLRRASHVSDASEDNDSDSS